MSNAAETSSGVQEANAQCDPAGVAQLEQSHAMLRKQLDAVGRIIGGNTLFGDVVPYVDMAMRELNELRDERRQLREALQWYARDALSRDGGQRARKALAETEDDSTEG